MSASNVCGHSVMKLVRAWWPRYYIMGIL